MVNDAASKYILTRSTVEDDSALFSTHVEIVPYGGNQRLKELVTQSSQFERQVKEALTAVHSPFRRARIKTELALRRSAMAGIVIDAVAETSTVDFVIEIRNTQRPSGLLDAVTQAIRAASTYSAFLAERGRAKPVVPVLILPVASGERKWPSRKDGALIISFNPSTSKFVGTEVLDSFEEDS
ncbi:hypothetical protein [Ramlibacter pallidus]|uniref:Uncharacterized protein n=1 Tax=Ramlibacter pallidus TaxID=2780087 RepID=A0ABR9S956_9BURK|nr:hypothetical protein [Ramlibacter pallidus]MBE7370038.1 hypothetical protein [Ramlibacter pallidus]